MINCNISLKFLCKKFIKYTGSDGADEILKTSRELCSFPTKLKKIGRALIIDKIKNYILLATKKNLAAIGINIFITFL